MPEYPLILGIMGVLAIFRVFFQKLPPGYKLIVLIGFLYPIGEICQVIHVHNHFITAHLSDIGFVPCWVGWYLIIKSVKASNVGARVTALAALYVAIAYEMLQFMLPVIGPGDWGDIICFVASFVFVLLATKTALPKKSGK